MSEKSTGVQAARSSTAVKLVEPHSLFDRMGRICDSISRRAFELFERKGSIFGADLDDWFQAEAELLRPIHLHIDETENAFSIRAEVPGFSAKELEVSIEPQRLVISGKRESKEEAKRGQTIRCECCSNEILRVIDLPAEVNTSGVAATLNNGVLELELQKAARKQPVRIVPKTA
jgi:HSP20 family protein